MSSPSCFKIRDAILCLGRNHDPASNWSGIGNFRFAHPHLISQDDNAMMFGIRVDSQPKGIFSADARIIVRNTIGSLFSQDGFYRACNMNLDWHGSIPLASFQPESCFVQLKYHHFDEIVTAADLYCGGFGGWQHAAEFLTTHFDSPLHYLWAVDRDSTAAKCHSQNFGGTLLSEEVVEHYPLPKGEKVVICGSCDYVLLNKVNFQLPTKGATASFPCPPWSRGSKGKGFEYQDGGLAILEILRAGIVNNWQYILLENVDAIVEHFHYAWIRTYIDDAGYYIAYSNVSCISDISAAKRKRWVCVIVQKHLQCRIPSNAFEWSSSSAPTLRSTKVMPSCLPDRHEEDLTLNNVLLNIYGNPVFAPPGLKTRFSIDKRIKHGYEQMSTATATYGRQHELPDEIIRTEHHSQGKGIYADLVQGKFGPRFWSPVEIAMTMIIFKRTFFPLTISDAHKLIGNAISTLHAIKVIHAFIGGFTMKRTQCFDDVFHFALMKRLHMENSNIYIQDDWIVVEPIAFKVKDIEISLTLPMPRTISVVLKNEQKTIEIPDQSTIDDLLAVLEIPSSDVYVSWKPAHVRARKTDHQIPQDVEEVFLVEKFSVHSSILPIDIPFVNECIRQIRTIEETEELPLEPVFFPIQVSQDGRSCMTVNAWSGCKVHSIAKECWNAVRTIGCEVSCVKIFPPVENDQLKVGWWHLSTKGVGEIQVTTRLKQHGQCFSVLVWDDDRKHPALGQRIGEASHPGPFLPRTLEFKVDGKSRCFDRQDINGRISKFDIAALLDVKIDSTVLWDPFQQKIFPWEKIGSCDASVCYVKPASWKKPQMINKGTKTFWDLLPTSMPKVKKCKIKRDQNLLFGTIHRLCETEIFGEQFERILQNMNEQFAEATNHELQSPLPCFVKSVASNLLCSMAQPQDDVNSTEKEPRHENFVSMNQKNTDVKEPENAADKNVRRCKRKSMTDQSKFWIHLPVGKHCVMTSAEGCNNINDLIKKAFLEAKISNAEYITTGCYYMVNTKICEPHLPIDSIPGSVIRVFLRGLRGGGKEDILRVSSARLGEILIHKGLPINAVAPKVQKIIEKIGLSQTHQALQNQSEIHAWRQIEHLAQSADFVIFNEKEKKGLSATLIQRAIKKKKKGNVMGTSIAVEQFTLPSGIFINEDQSETPIISIDKLRAGSHGIILTTEEKISPWIQNRAKSSADELGVIFLGNPTTNIDETFQPTAICFAALNQDGKECILRGTLLQLGGKKVELNRHFKVEGINAAMTTCSLTAFASDFEAESFATLVTSPAKHMLAQLPSDTIRNAISSVWGRSFMKDGKRVANLEADSVQVHISIKSEKVPDLLKCSGSCNIYITPKTENGLFDPRYHLIWTDLSKIAIEQKANEIQNHLGYIKGRKGFALRFLTADAADGFKTLYPSKDFEPPIAVNVLYKLQPVPFGILPEVLTEACKAIKWNIKPIKRSGNSWLVGAEKPSPNKFLIIDGTTILVKEVEKANSIRAQICLAGPRPKRNLKERGPDPFQNNDPWASFRPTQMPNAQPAATLQSANQGSNQSSQASSRTVTGPVEDRFKSQESRIQRLEQKLDDTVQHMHTIQTDAKQEFQKQQKEIVDMKESFKSELVGLQKGITMSFQDSLKQAIQQQTQDMRKLFLETPTGSSPLKKQPKTSS